MSIEADATAILKTLAAYGESDDDPRRGRYSLEGEELAEASGLDADRINDAVAILEDRDLVELARFVGTAPFNFGEIELTARGRLEVEQLQGARGSATADAPQDDVTAPANSRFEAIERLGEGAYGEVWRARDLLLNRTVAVKFVRAESADHDAIAHARALARVQHPNIVAVFDVTHVLDPVTNRPSYAIVMELVEGTVLVERLGRTMSVEETERIGTALLDAIDAYHQAGLAHLDVHDGNVMTNDHVVKVLDPLYLATADLRSTATLGSQQTRDARGVRDILTQMLHLGAVPIDAALRFERETVRPTIGQLRRSFLETLAAGKAGPHPVAVTAHVEARSGGRVALEREAARAATQEVVLVGGVTEWAGNIRRGALGGHIHLGQRDDSKFELRIPVRGAAGIPILAVPYGLLREVWVDAAGRLNVLLFSPVVWDGRELSFSEPFAR